MKPYQMTVSPDFSPKHISAWFVFNTWLQRALKLPIHLELYDDFDTQRAALASRSIDIIYANPFDASMLVRELGFVPVAYPEAQTDECLLVVPVDSPIERVEDLQPGARVASTDDPDVTLIGMIMLEPADLDPTTVVAVTAPSYPLVAAQLLRGKADVGFMLEAAYNDLSAITRRQLRPLICSQISDIRHALLLGPALSDLESELRTLLLNMHHDPAGARIVAELGMRAWAAMEREDTEFMIDLMDTLKA